METFTTIATRFEPVIDDRLSFTGKKTMSAISKKYRIHNSQQPSKVIDVNSRRLLVLAEHQYWQRNTWEAMQLAYPLAKVGNPHAQLLFGKYFLWKAAPQDYEETLFWHREAANNGLPEAQMMMDRLLTLAGGAWDVSKWQEIVWDAHQEYDKLTVKRRRADSRRDCQAATEWYRDCATMGEANAEFLYGFMHCAGIGVSKDDVRAHEWLRKAAKKNHIGAHYLIGYLYFVGKGVMRDLTHAQEWFRAPAELGDANAQFHVGSQYVDDREFVQAAEWYERSAKQGDASQACLAGLYVSGCGVPKDLALAYKWFTLSIEQVDGDWAVEERSKIQRKMTSEQIREAQRLASQETENLKRAPGGPYSDLHHFFEPVSSRLPWD